MSFHLSRRRLLGAGAGAALAAFGGAQGAAAAPVDERVLRAENSEGSYQSKFDGLVRQGYRPYIIDGWETGQVSMLSAIFRPINGITWRAVHGLSGTGFQADFDAAVRDGWRMTNVTTTACPMPTWMATST